LLFANNKTLFANKKVQKKMLRRAGTKVGLVGLVGVGGGISVLYNNQPGFRRTITFWSTLAPTIVEYKTIPLTAW
jgi:hypothetical protein